MGFFLGLAFAGIFFGIARYEHMNPWKWAIASLAVTFTVVRLFPLSFVLLLPAQLGLFLVLWWMNARRQEELKVERATMAAEDQRRRRERVSEAQAQALADPERENREAARAAAEEAERKERMDRVRLAREQREREEREQR
jgi:signal transduction histidine kinase